MRKPILSKDDLMKCIKEEKTILPSKANYTYSIEFLAHLAMSPRCLAQPIDWNRITQEYPDLIRNVSIYYFKMLLWNISRSITSNVENFEEHDNILWNGVWPFFKFNITNHVVFKC